MKILIIAPRYNDGNFANNVYMFPLGLGYISAVLKEAGHEVTCLNLNHKNGKTEYLVQEYLKKGPKYDYVCTGGLSNSFHQIKSITDAVRSTKTGIGVILGGGMISSEPELIFKTLKPDYLVLGEGEQTIQELLNCVETNGNIGFINGLGYQDKNGQFCLSNKRRPIMDLDTLPWPDFEGLEFEHHVANMRPTDFFFYDLFDSPRVYPIIGSRGCPFLCSFCFHPLGRKYRQRSINSIMSELEVMVKKHRINIIAIYDELFTYDKERVLEFCKRIKTLFDEISWDCRWNCQMRVDGLDEECLRTMKEAGCHMVSYGFESFSSTVLKSMRKHITPAQIEKAVEITLNNNISLQANFIFGDTAETAITAQETLEYWKKDIRAGIQLGLISAYPGTEIFKHCVEQGKIKDKLNFISNQIEINTTDGMNEKDFKKLKFDIFYAQLRFRPLTVLKSLKKKSRKHIHGSVKSSYELSVVCPHCKNLNFYDNYLIQFSMYFIHTRNCRTCYHRFFVVSKLFWLTNKLLIILYIISGPRLGKTIYFSSIKINLWVCHYKPFIKRALRYISFHPKS